jgi:arginine decarboxylase
VNSLHKAVGGLCQASMILLGGDLVDPVDLRLRLDLVTTTSPSALLYGSIDGWRRHRRARARRCSIRRSTGRTDCGAGWPGCPGWM